MLVLSVFRDCLMISHSVLGVRIRDSLGAFLVFHNATDNHISAAEWGDGMTIIVKS